MSAAEKHRAFVVGIGGIGVSALAQWLRAGGWTVSGSERSASDITAALEASGIPVAVPEPASLPSGTSFLVYSDAVPADHPLRTAARAAGVREASYPELLGELTVSRTTVAIAGSHGKSTTTALVGLLLEAAGRDPTVIVGTRVPQWMDGKAAGRRQQAEGNRQKAEDGTHEAVGNFRRGRSGVAVVEADEYRGHFLALAPTVAVVTSLDHDHVDAFPHPAAYAEVFRRFAGNLKPGGLLVLSADDPQATALRAFVRPGTRVRGYSVGGTADVRADRHRAVVGEQRFHLAVEGEDWGEFVLHVPGVHVVANALAAVAATRPFGVSPDVARRVLADFRGTWRRFEIVGEVNGAPVISDYAHHSTELRALAAAARQWYPDRRLVIAFQPHQHARTAAFERDFLRVLDLFDDVVLAEVYDVAGRESPNRVTTKAWVDRLARPGRRVVYAPALADVAEHLRDLAGGDRALFVVGAGDIDDVARRLTTAGK